MHELNYHVESVSGKDRIIFHDPDSDCLTFQDLLTAARKTFNDRMPYSHLLVSGVERRTLELVVGRREPQSSPQNYYHVENAGGITYIVFHNLEDESLTLADLLRAVKVVLSDTIPYNQLLIIGIAKGELEITTALTEE